MEHKCFQTEVKLINPDLGTVSCYLSVFGNEDYDGDIIHKGAFKKSIEKHGGKIPYLFSHDPKDPIGMGISAVEDDYGLKTTWGLVMEVQRARESRALMLAGALKGMSIGYIVPKGGSYEKNGVRHITEVDWLEGSPTVFASNPLATVTDVKHRGTKEAKLPLDFNETLAAAMKATEYQETCYREHLQMRSLLEAFRTQLQRMRI